MGSFLEPNFLLRSDAAERLYFEHAADLPIYDYHNHLLPGEIADDRRFSNLTEVWLDGDHYKWRAMRTAGVDEQLITGDKDPYQRFLAFAGIVPQCIGNPLYHWTHMELRKPFGIDDTLLDKQTAPAVWDRTSALLAEAEFSARGLLRQFDVRVVCTTDDPADRLSEHATVAADSASGIRMLPTWRPDTLLKPETRDFQDWVNRLAYASGTTISNYADLLSALERQLDHFQAHGCVSADHGLDGFGFAIDGADPEKLFSRRMNGHMPVSDEVTSWRSAMLLWLGREYAKRDWVMQLHIGALRDNNTRMHRQLGPNAGYDSIDDRSYALPLARFLDALDQADGLPRTILYCLNPRDNEMLATMTGNFQGGTPGRMQFGSAWWFNDQADGIRRQLVSNAQMGLLSRFVGMLTDSRSLLSFSRHDYFRRILCDLLGDWIERGEAPADFDLLGSMVRDISCHNTIRYFGFDADED